MTCIELKKNQENQYSNSKKSNSNLNHRLDVGSITQTYGKKIFINFNSTFFIAFHANQLHWLTSMSIQLHA